MKNIEQIILFEDTDILVLDKPWGITVNSSQTTANERTVQDYVAEYLKISKASNVSRVNGDEVDEFDFDNREAFYARSGIVHRLDKETSGVLLVAKNENSFINLLSQFKNRYVQKSYIALSHGVLNPRIGEISVPVGRLPWNRKQFGVVAGGRESVTKYKTITIYKDPKTKEFLSLLGLTPKTGRTHQIRVHLKYLNRPIFSDYLYAGRKVSRSDREHLPRVFLHAATLDFLHPTSLEKVTFESSLPKELFEYLSVLEEIE